MKKQNNALVHIILLLLSNMNGVLFSSLYLNLLVFVAESTGPRCQECASKGERTWTRQNGEF